MKSTAGASHTEEEKSRSLRPERGGVQTLKDPEKKRNPSAWAQTFRRFSAFRRSVGSLCVCVFFVHARLYPGFSPRFWVVGEPAEASMTAWQWCKAGWQQDEAFGAFFLSLRLDFSGMGSCWSSQRGTPEVYCPCFDLKTFRTSVRILVNIRWLVQPALCSPFSSHQPQSISNWRDSEHLKWWRKSSTSDSDFDSRRLPDHCGPNTRGFCFWSDVVTFICYTCICVTRFGRIVSSQCRWTRCPAAAAVA